MLGSELLNILSLSSQHQIIGVDQYDFDICSKKDVYEILAEIKPDIIIHCAAYTNVDKAEEEQEKCLSINFEGTKNLAEYCKEHDIVLCYISTDFVFDGENKKPYIETDKANPINYYGYSKYKAEEWIIKNIKKYFILRISWLYGPNGKNFVQTIINFAKEKKQIDVVDDQIGCPTYTKDFAKNILPVITSDKYGIYHMPGSGICSWFVFAKKIMEIKNLDVKVVPISSDKLNRLAKRPKNSVLNSDKLYDNFGIRMRPWEEALEDYLGADGL